MLWGNKPLPEPILTKILNAEHGHNELMAIHIHCCIHHFLLCFPKYNLVFWLKTQNIRCLYPVILTPPPTPGQNGCHFANTFICIFMNENFCAWFEFFSQVCSSGPNWQWSSIGSSNGLVPNRWQAITWTNGYPVHWRIYVALGGDELILMLACKFYTWVTFDQSILQYIPTVRPLVCPSPCYGVNQGCPPLNITM